MPAKTLSIISAVITAILLIILGVIILFFGMITFNGYSGSEGGPALTSSAVCQGIAGILFTILAGWLTKTLIAKFNWNAILAMITSITAALILGGVVAVISFFLALAVADSLR